MIDADNLPAAIQWHEGMLLAPQHFQQLSRRQEELLHYHLMLTAPFHWGIRKLKVDHGLLIDGTLRVLELEAVMPDGLIVRHTPEDDKNLETDLSPYDEEMKQKPLTIHLAVPSKRAAAASVKGMLPRFDSVEGRTVPDENTGESELSIPRLIPRISLLVTEIPPQKYTTFPLVTVGYRDETIALTDYVPPMLTIRSDSAIGEMCTSIAHKIREKAVFLSERLNSSTSMVKGSMVLETKFLIRSLISELPQFEAVVSTGVSHPYPLYLSLCALVGNVASLGMGMVPPVLPAYNHNDLRTVFENARKFVFRMVDEGILESHTAIPFGYDNGVFSLKLKQGWMSRNLTIGVKGKPGADEKDITAWIEESLIGSVSYIESMKDKRILGAERKNIETDGELVPARGVILFAVKTEPDDSSDRFIDPEETLQIFNNSDPEALRGPDEMMLYVKNTPGT
ncbi:MAG: type VI secretion system baseplate subunit TssK [Desulfobacterales bacterium]|nr:type VI secretion system baseplate subunit TssK [Desulfobacterales bacterium]